MKTNTQEDKVKYIMLKRATDEELARYSKATDYKALRDRLIKKYENNN